MQQTEDDIQLLKKSINEKDQQIVDLEKKLRLEQFRAKKQLTESNAKLENEKSTSQNYSEQISRFEGQISELQAKVSSIQQLQLSEGEKKNFQLIEEISSLKKRKASGSTDEDFQPKKEHIGDFPSLQQILSIIQNNQGNYQPELTKLYECYTEACQTKDEQIATLKEELNQSAQILETKVNQQLISQQQENSKQLELNENQIKQLKLSLEEKENEFKSVVQQNSDSSDSKISELEKSYQSQIGDKEKQLAESEKKAKLNAYKLNKQITEFTSQVENEKAKTALLQEQINRHSTQVSELEEKVLEYCNQLSTLETKNLQLIEETSQQKKQIEQLLEENIKDSHVDQPSYQDLVDLIQKYQNNEQVYQQELQNAHDGLQQRTTQNEQLQEEISQLEEQISKTEKKNFDSQKAMKVLEEQLQNQTQIMQLLKIEYEQTKIEKEQQNQEFMNKIKEFGELNSSIDDAVHDAETRYQKMMMIQEEQYQRREQELIHQIQQTEEKISSSEQQMNKLESKHKNEVKQIEEESHSALQQKQQLISQLQKQMQDELYKLREEQSRIINELKSDFSKKERLLESKISEITIQYEGETRKVKKMEIVIKKKEKEIQEEKENKKLIEDQLATLREKSNQMIENYENKIKEITIANQLTRQDQHRHSIFDQRMSISSSDINKTFEIEVLKAQIEQLQQKGDIELQAEINRLNERERQMRKEMVDLQNEIGNERLNYTVTQRQLEQEIENLNSEIVQLKQDQSTEIEEMKQQTNKLIESLKNESQSKIVKLELLLDKQTQSYLKKIKDLEQEKEAQLTQLKQTIKQLEDQIQGLKEKKTIKQQGAGQDDSVQLQLEINSLNERERQLRKEMLDLQNELGNQKLNQTILVRDLQHQVEQHKQEAQHASLEQEYAEQVAAKISIQYASLAMEYESAVLQNRNYRKSISKVKQ